MKSISAAILFLLLGTLVASVRSCLSSGRGPVAATSATFTDPFSYCTSIGTIDKPDYRYSGPAVPDQIINGFKKAAGLEASMEPMDVLRKTTVWRCMRGKVYACNFGANLPCDSKANTDKVPSQAMQGYCTESANSDFIPMSVTGHDTVYDWRCRNGVAEAVRQVFKVDAAGFLEQIWYVIQPGS